MAKRQKLSYDGQYREALISKSCSICNVSGSEVPIYVYIMVRTIPQKCTATTIREDKKLQRILNGEFICESCDEIRGHWCNGCKTWQPIDHFAVRNDIPQGRQSKCKECQKKDSKNTKDPIKKYLWEYRCQQTCADCKETDPLVIEFDHGTNADDKAKFKRHPDKKIGNLQCITNLEDLKEELKKCTPRCRLCHLKRTRTENPPNNLSDIQKQTREIVRNEKNRRGICHDCGKTDDVEYFSFLYKISSGKDSISTLVSSSSTENIIQAFKECNLVCPKCEVYRRFKTNPKFIAQLKWFVKMGYIASPFTTTANSTNRLINKT